MKKIGIVGGGIMAKGMVQNFLKHDYAVYIWNRTRGHVEDLLSSGATWTNSPKEVAKDVDLLIECVTNDEASKDVWTNTQTGILAGAHSEGVYIAASSLSLDWIEELAKLSQKQSISLLDMPLTGSRAGAESGKLRLLVGGDEAILNSIRQELDAIADKIYYFGPSGSGMRFKLILNTLIGIHTNAIAQAYVLAEKAGLDVKAVHHALFDGSMGPASPATNNFFNNLDMPKEQVNFAIQWIEKDLRYAQAMAKRYGIDFDLLNDTQADFAKAKEAGLGEQDQVKIVNLYRS
jgi:3-hydroxyisobutyrate dehydrogenase